MTKTPQKKTVFHARPKRVHVIANPASGRRIPLLGILNDVFRKAGIHWDIDITHETGDGAIAARRAVEDGADVIVTWGGDGTLMDAAGGLTGTNVPLLALSGGTGNLVAAELGIPRDPERALQKICRDSFMTRKIDAGQIGDRLFLLRIGCGLEAEALHDATREMKSQFGKWAYAFAAARALQEVRAADYEITLDDNRTVTGKGVACIVANAGRVGIGNLTLSPHIDMGDGLLDVVFLRKADVEGIFSLLNMMIGAKEQASEEGVPHLDASHLVSHWQVRKVAIKTDPVLDLQVDGDLLGATPLTATLNPAAIQIVV